MTKTSGRDLLDSVASRLERVDFLRVNGRVVQVVGLVLESEGRSWLASRTSPGHRSAPAVNR